MSYRLSFTLKLDDETMIMPLNEKRQQVEHGEDTCYMLVAKSAIWSASNCTHVEVSACKIEGMPPLNNRLVPLVTYEIVYKDTSKCYLSDACLEVTSFFSKESYEVGNHKWVSLQRTYKNEVSESQP